MERTISLNLLAPTLSQLSQEEINRVLQAARILAVSDVKNNFQQSRSPDGIPWAPLAFKRPRGGNKPLYDTGVLMNSIQASATSTTLSVFTLAPYAGVHQFGATIRPVRAKKLAIPVTREAQREGSPRNMQGLSPRYGRNGNGVLVETKGKGKRAKQIVHFVLVDEVTIPARPFLGFSENFFNDLGQLFADELRKRIEKG